MVFIGLLPDDIKSQLLCNHCLSPLSVPTIGIKALGSIDKSSEFYDEWDTDCSYICGRCTDIKDTDVRAHAFEALASYMTFPCKFAGQGCKKQLAWGSALDHEKCCKHRYFSCMLDKNCYIGGDINNLSSHFKNVHPEYILNKNFFFLPHNNVESHYILYLYNEIFLVEYKFAKEENIFSMNVKLLGRPSDSGRFTCGITLKEHKKKKSKIIELYQGKIKPYKDYGKQEEKMTIVTDLDSIKSTLKSVNINCKINITEIIPKKMKKPKESKSNVVDANRKSKKDKKVKNSKESKSNIATDSNEKVKKDETFKNENSSNLQNKEASGAQDDIRSNLLRELECPVCQEYMLSPIFVCNLGHSICGSCKAKLEKCPSCSSKYTNARNYTLENMLQILNFPCDNYSHGCKFKGNTIAVQLHKRECEFESIKCPSRNNCGWKGPFELLEKHLESQHEPEIINLSEYKSYNLESGVCGGFLIFKKIIIRIYYRYTKQMKGIMQWSFQVISNEDVPSKINMELEFLDQTNTARKFVINDTLQDIKEEKNVFKSALTIPISLLKPYICNKNLLHFKFN